LTDEQRQQVNEWLATGLILTSGTVEWEGMHECNLVNALMWQAHFVSSGGDAEQATLVMKMRALMNEMFGHMGGSEGDVRDPNHLLGHLVLAVAIGMAVKQEMH
jgi:hypothetical protein